MLIMKGASVEARTSSTKLNVLDVACNDDMRHFIQGCLLVREAALRQAETMDRSGAAAMTASIMLEGWKGSPQPQSRGASPTTSRFATGSEDSSWPRTRPPVSPDLSVRTPLPPAPRPAAAAAMDAAGSLRFLQYSMPQRGARPYRCPSGPSPHRLPPPQAPRTRI